MSDKIGCATTRFNSDSWDENMRWRDLHNQACIYNSSSPMAASLIDIPYVYVIEMNNDTNKVEGIGLVSNTSCSKRYRVYTDAILNLFTYKSNCRMDRSEFTEDSEKKTIALLDKILFKGYTHFKRGSGFTKLPNTLLFKTSKNTIREETLHNENWVQLFTQAFRRHYGKKFNL